VALGLLSYWLSRKVSRCGVGIFAILFWVMLTGLYAEGYLSAQESLKAHAWTAAALSVGLMPFLSIPIMIVAAFVALIMHAVASRSKARKK